MATKWRLTPKEEAKNSLFTEEGILTDEEIVRRINRQIWVKYPSIQIKISLEEYKAAKSEVNKFIKENVGETGIPKRGYDRDATLKWYPPSAYGKIEIDMRSRDSYAKVSPTSYQFQEQHRQKDMLQRTWIEMKAGASIERHCRLHNQKLKQSDTKEIFDFARSVTTAPDHLKEMARVKAPVHIQKSFDFAS